MTAPPADPERTRLDWHDWLAEINEELFRAFLNQELWTQMRQELLTRRPECDMTFLASYSQVYGTAQLSVIRRLADRGEDARSLVNLIQAIGRSPDVITRTTYSQHWTVHFAYDSRMSAQGPAVWDSLYADPDDRERVSNDLLAADIGRIDGLDEIVVRVTKRIADMDRRHPEQVPQFAELRKALDVCGDVTNTYQLLVDRSEHKWPPIIQGDWRAAFRPTLFPVEQRGFA